MIPGILGCIQGLASDSVDEGGGGATDSHWSSVKLLLSGNGANGSTTFTDESPVARGNATVNGDSQVTTTNPKFGSGAILFDGTGDYLSYADSVDWGFGVNPFTVEGWFRFDAGGIESSQPLISQWASFERCWGVWYRGDLATNQLQFLASDAGLSANVTVAADWTPTEDVWYHIAADRSGSAWRLYVDGVMIGSGSGSINMYNAATSLRIGHVPSGGATGYFNGAADEIRVTKGVARYASDSGYAVPTAAFPRS